MLIEAVRVHAVEGDEADRNSFQCGIADLEASLAYEPSAANALVTASAVIKARTFEMVGRSVVLPITSVWTLVPLFESGCAQSLSKLEAFNGSVRRS